MTDETRDGAEDALLGAADASEALVQGFPGAPGFPPLISSANARGLPPLPPPLPPGLPEIFPRPAPPKVAAGIDAARAADSATYWAGISIATGWLAAGAPFIPGAGWAAVVPLASLAAVTSTWAAMSGAQAIYHQRQANDPILLDLDGDGLALSSGTSIAFDLDSDGFREFTSWSTTDALLVRDLNNDGLISDGSEISFQGGEEGITDIQKLGAYDLNQDGKIDSSDAIFDQLYIWLDSNGNGISESAELTSLSDADVLSINIGATQVDPESEGVEFWFDANGNAAIETEEIYESTSVAPPGAIAIQRIEGGYILGSTTITTSRGIITAYATGMAHESVGFQVDLIGADSHLIYENGDSKVYRVLQDGAGEYLNLVDESYAGAFGGYGDDTITRSGAANSLFLGNDGGDVLVGGSGNDIIVGGAGADSLSGGAGDDAVVFDAADLTRGVAGGSGFDVAIAEGEDPVALDLGATGFEAASGNVGSDSLVAGAALDVRLHGGAGDDTLVGGAGSDELAGGLGADVLLGGDGDDILILDAQDAIVNGGSGRDAVFIEGAVGVSLDLTSSSVEVATGGAGDDSFTGGGAVDLHIEGGGGNDTIASGGGNDILVGGAGDDTLVGGTGLDAAFFAGKATDYSIVADGLGGHNVTDMNATDGDDGTDHVTGIERLVFSDGRGAHAKLGQRHPHRRQWRQCLRRRGRQ